MQIVKRRVWKRNMTKTTKRTKEKSISFFTDKNDNIDSNSNGDQADTVKGMVMIIFWIL